MSTATKLEYLNDTKQLLKENINNLGGNLTNEPFRQYASVLEGIYERLPKVSGIGASLSLSPSMVGKIKLNEIQGDTLQNGTPTPSSPVPIQSVTGLQNVEVCGKNLFDKTKNIVDGLTFGPSGELLNNTNFFYQNYYIPVQPNTTYSVSKTTGNNSLRICEYDSSKTFIKRNYEKHTITTSATTYFIRISNYKVQIDAMQLEQGSTATTYEPYKGNTYEVNLGKQLFDYSKINYIANGTHNSGVITQTGQNCYFVFSNDPISVNSGDTIYFSADIKLNDNSTGTFGNLNDNVNGGTTKILQPTLSTTYQKYQTSFKYNSSTKIDRMLVQILNLSGSAEITNIMISKSSNPTFSDYFPPIELNKIGDYEDSIKKSTGKNLCNGINQEVFLNATVDKCGIITGNTGLYIKVNGGTYTISTTTTQTRYRVACAINEPSATQQNVYNGVNKDNTRDSITIDTTGYNYLIVNSTDLSTIQIEKNNQATTYEPYGKVWYIEKNIGKGVLDGTKEWTAISMVNNYGYYTYLTNILSPSSSSELPKSLCNSFIPKAPNNQWSSPAGDNNYTIINTSNPNTAVRFSVGDNTNKLSDFKTWLNTNNIEIIYVLYTPIYEVITNTELIEQLESLNNAKSEDGTTNINVDGSLPVILGVKALKGE